MRGAAYEDRREWICVDIAIICQHSRRGNRERAVFIDVVSIVRGQRRVVDRGDRDGDGGRRRLRLSVAGLIGETVRAVVVPRRCIKKASIG